MVKPVSITRESCGPMWQVAAWPDTISTVAEQITDATGCAAPGPGGYVESGSLRMARTAPLVWWIIGEAPEALTALPPELGASLDITDSRERFVVTGPHASDLMRRLAPLDFRKRSFPVGHIAATVAHHLSVHIARREEGWDVYVTTTFADTMDEILQETALQWTHT